MKERDQGGSNKSAEKGEELKSSLIVMQLRSSANLYTVIWVISHLHRDERAYFIENLVSPLVTLMKADYCTQCNLWGFQAKEALLDIYINGKFLRRETG